MACNLSVTSLYLVRMGNAHIKFMCDMTCNVHIEFICAHDTNSFVRDARMSSKKNASTQVAIST